MKRKISILGSTGSIGRQALEVIESLPDKLEVVGLAAGSNIELLKQQIEKFKPQMVSVKTKELAAQLGKHALWGVEGLNKIAGNTDNDMVLMAVTGINGLEPTITAIENGISIALANKETLVAAGSIITKKALRNNVSIIPVDSEHSAIYQCINARDAAKVRKIILTASGGPFRTKSMEEIEQATVNSTLAHPKWSMGDKITVDSATLMNKGLEVIEAHWLFGIDYEDIKVVIHPQSIVHGAVEFLDGSYIAQLGLPTMHIPIQYALTYPKTMSGLKTGTLDLTEISRLEFEKPDLDKFPCLKLAYEAGKKGGTYPAALNAINEEAVYAFLEGKIRLTDIAKIVEKGLEEHESIANPTLEEILSIDKNARRNAHEHLAKICKSAC
ncbi:MAG: 1-deoxy-D-xylulose-5-phosphate reductoisomerase [Candidatus Melainabacteria bacterium GWF2_37_15]|nr:MAG: 1-deoxy-D-xylulose-5-phosphate reductoisomerase [Candidatus Melainabacteria bacterium GWF2_37_15]